MKQRILLSLSNSQKENAIASIQKQIQEMNSRINQRCLDGEEPPDDRDPDCMRIRKMRHMLTLLGST